MVAASVATGGGTVAPFLTGLVMNYGQTLDQYRQDPLALQENAREAAMINAFLSAPLDAFGAKGIGKAFIKPKTATGMPSKRGSQGPDMRALRNMHKRTPNFWQSNTRTENLIILNGAQ